MSLVFSGLAPHPPLLVPAIGLDNLARVEASRQALCALSDRVVASAPDTVVIVTPHGPVRHDALGLLAPHAIRAEFTGFDWKVEMRGDVGLGQRIVSAGRASGYPVMSYPSFDAHRTMFSRGLDHATMVPLYYMREAGLDCRLVVLSIASWSHRDHFDFGRALHEVLESAPERVALVASGDLSHRLLPEAPAGYDPRGADFDRRIVRVLETFDADDLLSLDDELVEGIGECGLRPLGLLFGALRARDVTPQVLSYEGPFGVGYCVAALDVGERLQGFASEAPDDLDLVLALVRKAVEGHVRGQAAAPLDGSLSPGLREAAAAFVCIKKDGVLRGCIGTTLPTQPTLVQELARNAVSAASRDPRFPPVSAEELETLSYAVDVLEPPEPVTSISALDPTRYGVIVRASGKVGVLLPGLEGVHTVAAQLEIACGKAGIDPRERIEIERFRVRRYERGR